MKSAAAFSIDSSGMWSPWSVVVRLAVLLGNDAPAENDPQFGIDLADFHGSLVGFRHRLDISICYPASYHSEGTGRYFSSFQPSGPVPCRIAHKSAASSVSIDRFTERVVTKIGLDVTANLIETTPVDFGWARANWVPSVGRPERNDPGERDRSRVPGAQAKQAVGQAALLRYKLGRGQRLHHQQRAVHPAAQRRFVAASATRLRPAGGTQGGHRGHSHTEALMLTPNTVRAAIYNELLTPINAAGGSTLKYEVLDNR